MARGAGLPEGEQRQALHEASLALARNPDVAAFARALVAGAPRHDRLGRLALIFTFVSHLARSSPPAGGVRDGLDFLLALLAEDEGPALVLTALLLALGERAAIERAGRLAFARVELPVDDVARLPPHACLLRRRGRYFIPLDARGARSPFAFLPQLAQRALAPR